MTKCHHRMGTINGLCIQCGMPIDVTYKYNFMLKRMVLKEELEKEKEDEEGEKKEMLYLQRHSQ